MYPVGWAARVLPTIPTLLGLQAAGLAFGVVPLWRIARRVADLRAGAALALIVAYGASPTINNLNLADFHPTAVAVAPLLAATYTALRKQWGYFFLWSLAHARSGARSSASSSPASACSSSSSATVRPAR